MNSAHAAGGMMTESKMWILALRDRLIWAVCLGAVSFFALMYFFAPPHFLTNIVDYLWAQLVVEFRSLPILGVRQSDLRAVAVTENRIAAQAGSWLLFTMLSAGVSMLFFVLSTVHLARRGKLAKQEKVLRGAEFANVKEHNRTMRKNFGKKPPKAMGVPMLLGKDKMIVPEGLQSLHFAFCGASGCGKSTAIEEIIEHGLRHGHKGFVIDLGGVFYSKFGRSCDHVLSLRDPRSKRWDFWNEPAATSDNIADAIVEAERTGTKFFWQAARSLWASLIRQCSTVDEVFTSIMKPGPELKEKLANLGEISSRVLGEGKGNQADGVLGTSVLNLGFLKELNQWSEDKKVFSITNWMNDNSDSSWVYVLVNDRDLEVAKPMLRVWFEMASLAVLDRNIGDPNNLHTWLIIDELKTIGQLPSLPHVLDKGRKYSASVVLGFQAISQVKKIYGEDDARSILQGLQNQFYFRMSEVESAQYVSEALGEQDVEQASFSSSYGPQGYGERGSISRTTVRRKLVLADEVRSLETLNAFAVLSGQKPVKVKFEPQGRMQYYETAVSKINEKEVQRFSQMIAAERLRQIEEKAQQDDEKPKQEAPKQTTKAENVRPAAAPEKLKQEPNNALISIPQGG